MIHRELLEQAEKQLKARRLREAVTKIVDKLEGVEKAERLVRKHIGTEEDVEVARQALEGLLNTEIRGV